MVKTSFFQCKRHGLDPWLGTRIPNVVWCGQKKKKRLLSSGSLNVFIIAAFDSPPTKSAKSNIWAILGLVSTDWFFLDCESHFPVSCMSGNF